ncbi:MAG: Outer rane receptor protein [Labilithrix sp.]|nr:Outer rane receptor protein [Labilithrix sp.]
MKGPRTLAAAAVAAAVLATGARSFAQGAPAITPPEPVSRVDAVYPRGEDRGEVDVVLAVTVDADGKVTEAAVLTSGGAAFDDAAILAAHQWTFTAARREGDPVPAKIRVAFHFAPPPAPAAAPPAPLPRAAEEPAEVVVRGRSFIPSRGAGDHEIPVGKLALVPRADAAALLRLAPGTFLTNLGGTGHPYQVFLRGFDAREGQDIEFTVDGMPINEVGNPHGNGLADTHFVIPELVRSLRVIEGPFAPQQGNFAVAGSALYELGITDPGLRASATYGSFGTKRLLLTWRPDGSSDHTFGGAEIYGSEGFGQNRKSERATAMGGYEGAIGKSGSWRVLLTSYAAHYSSAGVLREDDVLAGRRGFYDTYDAQQGGDSSRHALAATLQDRIGDVSLGQSFYLELRKFRLRENLTGNLLDPQQTWQTPHGQRGDLIDQQSTAITFGGRGSARERLEWLGQEQELELGYSARYDDIQGLQQRDRDGTNVPYAKDFDLDSGIANLGLHADASVRPFVRWITVRGGGRIDLYSYDIQDTCALRSHTTQAAVAPDTECFTADRVGPRSADQRSTTSASIFEPRATLLVGPFGGFTLSASHGIGSRSIDPNYVNQDLETPFAKVTATEAGVAYVKATGDVDLLAKSVFFSTSVDKDLFFNPAEGRSTLSDGTTRTGWSGNTRVTGRFFDVAASATFVRAVFDDTKLLVPYAPSVVLRGDGAIFGTLPFRPFGERVEGSAGLGVSYVGRRPLPFGEESNTIFTTDVAASLEVRAVRFGISCTNLFDRRYRVAELNYVSDFRSQGYPSLVAARHFTAGEPRAVFATFTLTFGGPKGS